jgi:hypothetical protein
MMMAIVPVPIVGRGCWTSAKAAVWSPVEASHGTSAKAAVLSPAETSHGTTTKTSHGSTVHTTKPTVETAATHLRVGRSRQQEQPTSCNNETSSNLHPYHSLACWLCGQLQI